jgi:lipoate-protein ligase A
VLHNRTLNISLILPSCHAWTQSIRGLYAQFVSVVSNALNLHGITASPCGVIRGPCLGQSAICFETHAHDSLLINQRKVFGCAQRRMKHATLVHGTLLIGVDIPLQSRVFGVPESRIENAMTAVPDGIDPIAIAGDLVGAASARLNLTPIICFVTASDPQLGSSDHSIKSINGDWRPGR